MADTQESRMVLILSSHLEKLKYFSQQFGMEPVFAQVICEAKNNMIHLFVIKVADIESNMKKALHGYSLSFGPRSLEKTKTIKGMTYSSWSNESISLI
jgi:hypothetical protein